MAAAAPFDHALVERLEERLGAARAKSRLAIELEHDAHALKFWQSRATHMEEWYRAPGLIRLALRLVGMLERARRSALDIRIVENELPIDGLDTAFDGFTLLHLSDLHVDINDEFVHALIERLRGRRIRPLRVDRRLSREDVRADRRDARRHARGYARTSTRPIYGVLGNHDSIRMVPAFEAMGIAMLRQRSDDDSARRRGAFNSPASTTRTSFGSTTSRRRSRGVRRGRARRSCCRTRPRSIVRRREAGFDRAVVRPHARRPDLPAGRISGHARCAHAAANRARAVASRRHARLYLGRRGDVDRRRADQLSAGDHVASVALRIVSG